MGLSNADGMIDAHDAAFADLQIWQDLNHDGVSDAGAPDLSGLDGLLFGEEELPLPELAGGEVPAGPTTDTPTGPAPSNILFEDDPNANPVV